MSRQRFGLIPLLLVSLACGSSQLDKTLRSVSAADLGKVEQKVVDLLDEQGQATIIIHLTESAELQSIATRDWNLRGQRAVDALRAVAARSQVPVLNLLRANEFLNKASGVEPLWICNCVVVTADQDTIATLAERSDVKRISANQPMKVDLEPVFDAPAAPVAVEWNVSIIRANDVWADFGITGKGITVGSLDTGVRWDHPALKSKYRGWDGATATHDYNWFDATRRGSRVPVDSGGHGTHTMGTIVGDDGDANQIGVAPGAKWIASAMIEGGDAWIVAAHRAFQWMIAPTDLDGANPDPDRRPAVVNNSWGCFSAICRNFEEFRDDVDAWIAAGIFPEFSAGNEGPRSASMRWPGGYAEAFSTGATTREDTIAGFSSRGPGQDGTTKPEVVAPGDGVRSSIGASGYGSMSGTSMAGPHVVGLVALLLEVNPLLTIDELATIIETTAIPMGDPIPNNTYGWGRIDAYSAVGSILAQ